MKTLTVSFHIYWHYSLHSCTDRLVTKKKDTSVTLRHAFLSAWFWPTLLSYYWGTCDRGICTCYTFSNSLLHKSYSTNKETHKLACLLQWKWWKTHSHTCIINEKSWTNFAHPQITMWIHTLHELHTCRIFSYKYIFVGYFSRTNKSITTTTWICHESQMLLFCTLSLLNEFTFWFADVQNLSMTSHFLYGCVNVFCTISTSELWQKCQHTSFLICNS